MLEARAANERAALATAMIRRAEKAAAEEKPESTGRDLAEALTAEVTKGAAKLYDRGGDASFAGTRPLVDYTA